MSIKKAKRFIVSNTEIEMSVGLVRQRRNLLLAASLLFVYTYTSATISKDINILGIAIDVENTKKLEYFPLLVCFYFFVRFLQYLSQEDRPTLKEIYIEFFHRITQRKIQRIARNHLQKKKVVDVIDDVVITTDKILPFPFHQKSYQKHPSSSEGGKSWFEELPFYKRPIGIHYSPKEWAEGGKLAGYSVKDSEQKTTYLDINLVRFSWKHIAAIYRALFFTSHFTDYYLPIAVGSIAILYFCWNRLF